MLSVVVGFAEATTKLVASLFLFLGFNCKQRPFKDPPRKLELGSLRGIGFCKMADFGEETVMAAIALLGILQ